MKNLKENLHKVVGPYATFVVWLGVLALLSFTALGGGEADAASSARASAKVKINIAAPQGGGHNHGHQHGYVHGGHYGTYAYGPNLNCMEGYIPAPMPNQRRFATGVKYSCQLIGRGTPSPHYVTLPNAYGPFLHGHHGHHHSSYWQQTGHGYDFGYRPYNQIGHYPTHHNWGHSNTWTYRNIPKAHFASHGSYGTSRIRVPRARVQYHGTPYYGARRYSTYGPQTRWDFTSRDSCIEKFPGKSYRRVCHTRTTCDTYVCRSNMRG